MRPGGRTCSIAMALLACLTGSAPGLEPAPAGVPLPHPDILNPDGAAPSTGGTAPRPESEREIRRPNTPADASPVRSEAASDDQRVVQRQGTGTGGGHWSSFVPLLIVLGLVLAAAWAIRRFMPTQRLATGAGVLEVATRLPLSSKHSLVLVKMGPKLILVGLSPDRVSPVCVVDDPEQVAVLVGRIASQGRGTSAAGFDRTFDEEAAPYDQPLAEEIPLQGAGPVRGLLEKVRRLSGARDVA